MKIKTRFLFSTIFCLGMSLVIGVIVLFTWRQANEAVKHHTVAAEVVKGVFELNLLTNDCLLYRHIERAERQWQSRHDSLTRLLSGDQFKRPRQRVILDRIREDLEDMKTLFSQLHIVQPGGNREKTALSVEQEARLIARLMTKSQAMVSKAFQLDETSVLDIGAAQDRANLLVMFLIVFIVVAAAATSIWVGRSVLKPVRELQKGTEIIGAGSLDHKVGTAARDEIGHLSRAFDQMTERLKTITVSRDDLAKEVSQRKRAEKELRKHRENLEKMVEDLNKTSKELIERTAELTAANAELAKVVEDLEKEIAEHERTAQALVEASQAAEAANEAKSEFLANMSHELRTPLNSIIGFSEVMIDDMAGPVTDDQKEYLNDILESGKHLLSLINDILDLSKVEAGKMDLEFGEISLKDLLEASLIMFKEKAMKHNIKLSTDISEDVGHIVADERKLKQVMFNLLSNAIKFTPDGGKVGIKGSKIDKEVQITVWDTGVGISKKDMNKLFQPFQQIETMLTKKQPGTGLGLNLSKKLVELQGGRLWVESQVGKGSKFSFTIAIRKG